MKRGIIQREANKCSWYLYMGYVNSVYIYLQNIPVQDIARSAYIS